MFKTAFSNTVRNFHSWPKLTVKDMNDYSLANSYQGTSNYVWYVNESAQPLKNFNWNYRPEDAKRLHVHSFPKCLKNSKRPISWNNVKLVPTASQRNIDMHRVPIISEYNPNDFPITVYSLNATRAVQKFKRLKSLGFDLNLIKSQTSFQKVQHHLNPYFSETHLWLLDLDMDIGDFYFDYQPKDSNTFYYFKAHHRSLGININDRSCMLVPKSFILSPYDKKHNPNEYKHKNVNLFAGTLIDDSDPLSSWSRAFEMQYRLLQSNHTFTDSVAKRIQKKLLETKHGHKKYITHASTMAKQYYEKHPDIASLDHKTLENMFKQRQQESAVTAEEVFKKRYSDVISRVYGKEMLASNKKRMGSKGI